MNETTRVCELRQRSALFLNPKKYVTKICFFLLNLNSQFLVVQFQLDSSQILRPDVLCSCA